MAFLTSITAVFSVGEISTHKPVFLIAGITSRHESALAWTLEQTTKCWGKLALQSPVFDFTETDFYTKSMGSDLKKQFLVYDQTIVPSDLAPTKIQSNDWEQQYADQFDHPEQRPLNIDPGYISEAKLVLATTKDRDHRIYLLDGIYAEVTLHFRSKQWTSSRWTYPDYQREDFQAFFSDCRNMLRERIRASNRRASEQ
ncbi:MAG: hypothetical protein ACI87E_003127 [Mariniblastus sp.]